MTCLKKRWLIWIKLAWKGKCHEDDADDAPVSCWPQSHAGGWQGEDKSNEQEYLIEKLKTPASSPTGTP